MSVVQLVLQTPTELGHLETIDEDRIRAHSGLADQLLGPKPTEGEAPLEALTKTITLRGAAPAALKYILERIKKNKTTRILHVKVHDLGLPRAVAIYEAAELLQLQPHQPQIEGHIVGYISHNLVTPEEMIAVHRIFESRQNTSKTWRVLIHQIAWNLVHSRYTGQQADELVEACKVQYPDLYQAIDHKIVHDLKPKKDHRDAVLEWEKQRKDRKGYVKPAGIC